MYLELQLKQDILAYKSVFMSPNIRLFFILMFPKKGAKVYYQSLNVYSLFSSHEKQNKNEWHYLASARKPGLNVYLLELVVALISVNRANLQLKAFL